MLEEWEVYGGIFISNTAVSLYRVLQNSNRSDEGLTLETSAFFTLYGGQFTFSTQLLTLNYLLQIEFAIIPIMRDWRRTIE